MVRSSSVIIFEDAHGKLTTAAIITAAKLEEEGVEGPAGQKSAIPSGTAFEYADFIVLSLRLR
jgi:hypothetical protein